MNLMSRKYTYIAPRTSPSAEEKRQSSAAAGMTSKSRGVIGAPTIGSATTRITVEIASVKRFAAGATSGSTARGKKTLSVMLVASTIEVVDDAIDPDKYSHGTMPART